MQRGLLERVCDFRLGLLQRTGGGHVRQRASDARIPYYKHISVIKGLFKNHSFLLFCYRKNLPGEGARGCPTIKFLLLILFEK